MWIHRTPEQMIKWQNAAEREASSHGRLIAGIVWILVSIFAAAGYFFIGGSVGIMGQQSVSGSVWLRLPVFGLISAPLAYWIYRRERRKELAKITQRTICPGCDASAEGNAGIGCKCGGNFVLSSTMKWVEK